MITITAVKKAIHDGNLNVVKEYFEKIEQSEAPAPHYLYKVKAEFLFESVQANNLEAARYLRSLDASFTTLMMRFDKESEKFVETKSALHLAAELNNVSMLHLFLGTESGESNIQFEKLQYPLNREDAQGNTPLHYACKGAVFSAAKLLVELGANPEVENSNNHSAASMAPDYWQIRKLFQKKIEKIVLFGDLSDLDPLRLTQAQINYALNIAYKGWFLYKHDNIGDIVKLSKIVRDPHFRPLEDPYGYSLLYIALLTKNQDLFSEQLNRAKFLESKDYLTSIRELYLGACESDNLSALLLLFEIEPVRNLKRRNEDDYLVIDMLRRASLGCIATPSSKMIKEILSRIELSSQEILKLNDIEKSLKKSIESYGNVYSKEVLAEKENILDILHAYKQKVFMKKVAYGILAVGGSALVAKWSYNQYCSRKNSKDNADYNTSSSQDSSADSNHRKELFPQPKRNRSQPTMFPNGSTTPKEQKAAFHSHASWFSLGKSKGIGSNSVSPNLSCSMPLFGFGNHFASHNTLHPNGMGFKYGVRVQHQNTRCLSKLFLRR